MAPVAWTPRCLFANRDKLLGALESGYSDLDQFNHVCSESLGAAAQRELKKQLSSDSLNFEMVGQMKSQWHKKAVVAKPVTKLTTLEPSIDESVDKALIPKIPLPPLSERLQQANGLSA